MLPYTIFLNCSANRNHPDPAQRAFIPLYLLLQKDRQCVPSNEKLFTTVACGIAKHLTVEGNLLNRLLTE